MRGEGGVAGSQPMSTTGAQINFGDLTLNPSYGQAANCDKLTTDVGSKIVIANFVYVPVQYPCFYIFLFKYPPPPLSWMASLYNGDTLVIGEHQKQTC
jgi:hypothetical protein